MTYRDLAKAIRAARGPIYGTQIGVNDVHHIQLVKADLLHYVTSVTPEHRDSESGLTLERHDGDDRSWYLDADHDATT